jgi:hexosaminidase
VPLTSSLKFNHCRSIAFRVFLLAVLFSPAQPFCQVSSSSSTPAVMPLPASFQRRTGQLPIDSNFTVEIQGRSSSRLQAAAKRAIQRLNQRSGATLKLCHNKACHGTLLISVQTPGDPVQTIREDESYSLNISADLAVLQAHTEVGVIRGLETLIQLVDTDSAGFFLPAVNVEDRPRFLWRGLLIDPARHWLPVDVVKRLLDGMAAVKLNVLHWHLSDDQGFRVESRVFPRLHQMGSTGQYYRQSEIREIVAYARDRGIRVIPEFDMPAHAHSWFIGYPQLASAPGPYEFKYYLGGDSVPIDPTRESTYAFIDKFVGEMAALFPDQYWHIGGDEVEATPWDANPAISAFKKSRGMKDNAALQVYFNRRLVKILKRHGKRMMGWDEIINPDLPKDIVVQSWRGRETLALTAKQGYDSILSAPYYLDKMLPSSTYYAGDPLPADSQLSAAEAAHILGGEVCVWGELVSEENIESRAWPYAAAVAERLWSPREVEDATDMYRRLEVVSLRLEEAGSRHRSNMEAMLRRAAGGDLPAPVRDFVGLLQPLRLGLRQELLRPTQEAPLTALGDIVVADPPDARKFAAQVDAFLANRSDQALRSALLQEFAKWKEFKPAVTALAGHAPLFRDAEATAADLADLAVAGEEAVSHLSVGTSPPTEWIANQKALVERAAKPKGLLRIAVLDAIGKLLSTTKTISNGR